MIELARSQLSPRDAERWRAALSEPAAVARKVHPIDPELQVLVALLWLCVYLPTFDVSVSSAAPLGVACVRIVAAGAALWIARHAEWAFEARRAHWPRGRFLFSWGWVEVERDVMRIAPIDELEIGLRGRALGVGPIRMRLRAPGLRTALSVDPAELPAIAAILEQRADAGLRLAGDGYRDARTRIEGPAARPRLPPLLREALWTVAVAVVALLLPGAFPLHPVVVRPPERTPALLALRPSYRDALAVLPPTRVDGLDLELAPCAPSPLLVDTVSAYLLLALTSPRLGPARPYGLPSFAGRGARDRFAARCTWHVDDESGLFSHAEAEWDLQVAGVAVERRHATVTADQALHTLAMCSPDPRYLDVSPRGIARATSLVLLARILDDVFEISDKLWPEGEAGSFARCALGQR